MTFSRRRHNRGVQIEEAGARRFTGLAGASVLLLALSLQAKKSTEKRPWMGNRIQPDHRRRPIGMEDGGDAYAATTPPFS